MMVLNALQREEAARFLLGLRDILTLHRHALNRLEAASVGGLFPYMPPAVILIRLVREWQPVLLA